MFARTIQCEERYDMITAASIEQPTNRTVESAPSDSRGSPSRLLKQARVRSYVDDGFLVVNDAVTRDEIDELSGDMLKLLRGGYDCPQLKPLPSSMTDDE